METRRFGRLVDLRAGKGTRRGLTLLFASLPLAGSLGAWLGQDDSAARKKHKKRKKKCGKAGGKPVKGKCCARTVAVDGTCRTCDVCTSGCTFISVQAAINAASAGDTLALCPGTYGGGLTIGKNLRLVGGGGTGNEVTVLQGAGDVPVVTITTGGVILQDLRVTGGGGDGAGIKIQAGTVDLITATVSGNTSSIVNFGAITNGGTLRLTDSTVSDNDAGIGAGIFNDTAGSLQLTRSRISGNTAESGGGMYNRGSVVFDASSRVTGNTANVAGGGIYNAGGTVTLATSANVNDNKPNNCRGMPAIALCND